MAMPREEFQRRAEQLEDVVELVAASGFKLKLSKFGTLYALELVRGDRDEVAVVAYLELED